MNSIQHSDLVCNRAKNARNNVAPRFVRGIDTLFYFVVFACFSFASVRRCPHPNTAFQRCVTRFCGAKSCSVPFLRFKTGGNSRREGCVCVFGRDRGVRESERERQGQECDVQSRRVAVTEDYSEILFCRRLFEWYPGVLSVDSR